jgi:hypothetical protein
LCIQTSSGFDAENVPRQKIITSPEDQLPNPSANADFLPQGVADIVTE